MMPMTPPLGGMPSPSFIPQLGAQDATLGGGMDGPRLNELIALSLAGQEQSPDTMMPPGGLDAEGIDPGILLQLLLGLGVSPGEEMLEPPMPGMGMSPSEPMGPPMGAY